MNLRLIFLIILGLFFLNFLYKYFENLSVILDKF